MNKDILTEKRTTVNEKFEQIKAEIEELDKKKGELNTELVKLQGEYRVLTDLIGDQVVEGELIDANTIVAEPKRSKNAK